MTSTINKINRLDTTAFLATLQLIIPDSHDLNKIKGFGSGFLLRHQDRLFFITADHVVHLDDHDSDNMTGQRTAVDYSPQIITNQHTKAGLNSITLPISGFYHLTGFGFDEDSFNNTGDFFSIFDKILDNNIDINDESLPIDVRIASFPDIAISELKEPLSVPILSNLIVMENDEILIKDGTPKICLDSSCISDFNKENWYVVAGTVRNEIKNSITIDRTNIFHESILFEELDSDKNTILKIPGFVDIQYWEGLSGAPILDDNGLLAGMLIRGPISKPFITAIPIQKIIWFLDIIIENKKHISSKL